MKEKYIYPKILFVDDEQNIIDGIKRSLFQYRKEWEMHFVTSGAAALEIIENNEINVIVSDIRMPKMNGVDLLFNVREKHPEIIRIILSGHSDEDLLLKATLAAHQFLNKPVNSETLIETIKELFYLRAGVRNKTVLKVVNGIMELPVNRHFSQIEIEMNSEDISISRIASYVSTDINLTAKILHIVNSAFFGLSQKIAGIEMAISFLGLNTIRAIMYLLKAQESFRGLEVDHILINNLFEHSLRVAKASELISIYENGSKQDAKDSYTAGLLHDIGKLVLCYIPEYREEVKKQKQFLSCYQEFELLGVSHAEVGAYLLGVWNLPAKITEAIGFHHNRMHFTNIGVDTIIFFANYIVKFGLESQVDFTPELNDKVEKWAVALNNLK